MLVNKKSYILIISLLISILSCAKSSPQNQAQCGDGFVHSTEECDEGTHNGAPCPYGAEECQTCSTDCKLVAGDTSFCGDSVIHSDFEECDGLTEDTDCTYGETFCWICNDSCQTVLGNTSFCGDGEIDTTYGEECDDAGQIESCDYGVAVCNFCGIDCQLAETTGGSCGDGILQNEHEACDDGNNLSTDYCRADCQEISGICGDGLVQSNEVCDDQNTQSGDHCRADCLQITGACGDSILQNNEACDDGNAIEGDYCSADCTSITGACGDGATQSNEACDDGNTSFGDYCSADCQSINGACGDSLRQSNEVCDDGNANDGDYCNATCTAFTGHCGDNLKQDMEACDDGNNEDGDYCSTDCLTITGLCGDEVIQPNENCDDGNILDDDYCINNCQTPNGSCGDTVVQPNENCDDGNTLNNDHCAWDCQTITGECGDGSTQDNEACDDSNTVDGDYCAANCLSTTGECGDGVTQTNEICDDGNTQGDDYCTADCQTITGACGDGTLQPNEVCEDQNQENGDYCSATCQQTTGSCGDGILQDNETCDDGNTSLGDYCSDDCQTITGYCGDDTVQSNEDCDDGNNEFGDYCASNCQNEMGACGDGLRQSNEICDDNNTQDGDYCSSDCSTIIGSCGDDTTQTNEACDDNNTDDGDYCASDCQTVTGECGDELTQLNEACDDGNTADNDYCQNNCLAILGYCGDTTPQGNEACDDGNMEDGDYCSGDCQTITGECGDHTVQENETCDDDNTEDDDYCSSDCQTITGECGDNITQGNEACDDNNTEDGDYCSGDCLTVTGYCGDNIPQNNEGCDDGNNSNTDSCLNECIAAACGDGYLWDGNEECDTALDNSGLNGDCYNCILYCTENTNQIFLNHNGDFSDGCEEAVYAFSVAPGETEIDIKAIAVDGDKSKWVVGAYEGLWEGRNAPARDGFVQKRNSTGASDWTSFLFSHNNVLPADTTYEDEMIQVMSTDEKVFAIGHYCKNSDTSLGLCSGYVHESIETNSCLNNNDCEDGRSCNLDLLKCMFALPAEVASGMQNGVLLSYDKTGELLWHVDFLSVWDESLSFNSDIKLLNATHDSDGNIYVIGTFESNMKIFSSGNAQTQEWENASRDIFGFVAKISSSGTLVWLHSFVDITPEGIAVAHFSENPYPQIALGGIEAVSYNLHAPYFKVFDQNTSGLILNWQLENPIGGYKHNHFSHAIFDHEGGIWVAGRAGYLPSEVSDDYDLGFDSCSNGGLPTTYILVFDGNDYVSLPSNEDLGYVLPLAISGWFYVDDAETGPQTIWGGGTNYLDSFMLFINQGRLQFQRCHNGDCNANLSTATDIQSGTWTHFAFTILPIDTETVTAQFYINGQIDNGGDYENWLTPELDTTLYLGKRNSSENYLFGQLTNIGFWKRNLDASEIQSLANLDNLTGDLLNDLSAYYTMETSNDSLLSTVDNDTMAASLVGPSTQWCHEPTEECPSIVSRNGIDACGVALECALTNNCYAETSEAVRNACLDTCGENLSGDDGNCYTPNQASGSKYTFACINESIDTYCSNNPNEWCFSTSNAAWNYKRCIAPNKDATFVAYYAPNGQCTFSDVFYNADLNNSEARHTRTRGLDLVYESVILSLFDFNDTTQNTIALVSPQGVEGGGFVSWSHVFASPDQTPVSIRDVDWDEGFLYYAAHYQSQSEMSFEVDFVDNKDLNHTACNSASCSSTGVLIKTRVDPP